MKLMYTMLITIQPRTRNKTKKADNLIRHFIPKEETINIQKIDSTNRN